MCPIKYVMCLFVSYEISKNWSQIYTNFHLEVKWTYKAHTFQLSMWKVFQTCKEGDVRVAGDYVINTYKSTPTHSNLYF